MCVLHQASKKQTWNKTRLLRLWWRKVNHSLLLAIHNAHELSPCLMQYVTQINDLWDLRAWQGLMESFGTVTVFETGESLMRLASWIWLFLSWLVSISQSPSPATSLFSIQSDSSFNAVGDMHMTNWQKFQVTYSAGALSCDMFKCTVRACNFLVCFWSKVLDLWI